MPPTYKRQSIGEHLLVVAVPVALENLVRVVLPLQAQEFGHLRIARLDLLAGRPAVVGEEVAAAERDGAVDQAAEVSRGLADAVLGVLDVQVHDDAGPRLARPGEEALVVALDEADRAVDELDAVPAEVRAHGGEEFAAARDAARRSR